MRPVTLLPQPQTLTLSGGAFTLPSSGLITLDAPRAADLYFSAQQVQSALKEVTKSHWHIAAGGLDATATITLDPSFGRPEGYRLTIAKGRATITGNDLAGAFYGAMTLCQLLQTHGSELPLLVIEDWPDFPARGVMLDISRDKVPTMETLLSLVDTLACWKVNQFQLYTEHTFAYRNHRAVWQGASPMTAEEILALDAYCRQRHVEFVPNQASFGHMNRWFDHEAYLPLGETDLGITEVWGFDMRIPFSLSPAVPETLLFLKGLFDEMLPNFTSSVFNVNCDETFDLGMGRSAGLVAAKGKGRVYLEFMLEIDKLVKSHGRTMQFWSDIISQYPKLVPEIPRDAVALVGGYDIGHEYLENMELFAESDIPFYVCPGTSAWWSITGRTDNCLGNLREAAENGLKNGAIGFLNTDWGDTAGYRHYLPVSYLGFAYGAGLSWALAPNVDMDVPAMLDTFGFRDHARVMGRLAYDLGNAYQKPGVLRPDGSLLYSLYPHTVTELRQQAESFSLYSQNCKDVLVNNDRLRAALQETVEYISAVMASLGHARMERPDAELIKREFAHMALMAHHAARRGLVQLNHTSVTKKAMRDELDAIEAEYPELWLARARPGGMSDSLARIMESRDLYE